ncbi:hypothetical protein M758_9G001900 [Ceratodon purpureus]|nr:hypothetical protein M758_9G001900 [Ceratodon purpureus]
MAECGRECEGGRSNDRGTTKKRKRDVSRPTPALPRPSRLRLGFPASGRVGPPALLPTRACARARAHVASAFSFDSTREIVPTWPGREICSRGHNTKTEHERKTPGSVTRRPT